ncbi:MAG TPA: M48 family metalloprotease [Kofleriaceae bacterium]
MTGLVGCADLAGLVPGVDDYDGPPPNDQKCDDPQYGDGTCQLALTCGIPDIDCFKSYESDEAATHSPELAPYGRAIATSDARVRRARMIANRVWGYMAASRPLGDLAQLPLAVEVLDNDQANAFVAPASKNAMALAIFINTGLLSDAYSDDAIAGTLAHEIGHLLGLHGFPEVQASFSTYYIAGDDEPLGLEQQPNAALAAALAPWLADAAEVGGDHRAQLGDLLYTGQRGRSFMALAQNVNDIAGDCAPSAIALMGTFNAAIDQLTLADGLDLDGAAGTSLANALSTFQTCMRGTSTTYNDLVSAMAQSLTFAEPLRSDETSLADANVVETFTQIARMRRTELAQLEASITAKFSTPWSSLRWYSWEEAADDVAVRYSQLDKLAEPGTALLAGLVLGDRLAACEAARVSNTVPYAADLAEPHHALCWRRDHAFRYAAKLATQSARFASDAFAPRIAPGTVPTIPMRLEPIY